MRIVDLVQGSPAWLAWRNAGIGGSDVAAILGVSPFEDATRERLMEEKLYGRKRDTNYAMRRGTSLEPVARKLFEQRTGLVWPPMCVEDEHQTWAKASLDGINFEQQAIIEIKAPNWKVHDAWLLGLVPEYYAVQMQWNMLIAGVNKCHAVSFNNGSKFAEEDHLAYVIVEADAEIQGGLIDAATAFWDELQEKRSSPATAESYS